MSKRYQCPSCRLFDVPWNDRCSCAGTDDAILALQEEGYARAEAEAMFILYVRGGDEFLDLRKQREEEGSTLKWRRVDPGSDSDFDLVLDGSLSPGERAEIGNLLDRIDKADEHRGLKPPLDQRARKEFRRWLDSPNIPLRSQSYARLSNWFLSTPTYSNTEHARLCEALWDALFPCPPPRLTSTESGQNHIVILSKFETWWQAVEAWYQTEGEQNEN